MWCCYSGGENCIPQANNGFLVECRITFLRLLRLLPLQETLPRVSPQPSRRPSSYSLTVAPSFASEAMPEGRSRRFSPSGQGSSATLPASSRPTSLTAKKSFSTRAAGEELVPRPHRAKTLSGSSVRRSSTVHIEFSPSASAPSTEHFLPARDSELLSSPDQGSAASPVKADTPSPMGWRRDESTRSSSSKSVRQSIHTHVPVRHKNASIFYIRACVQTNALEKKCSLLDLKMAAQDYQFKGLLFSFSCLKKVPCKVACIFIF